MSNLGYIDSATPIQEVDEDNDRVAKLTRSGAKPVDLLASYHCELNQVYFAPVSVNLAASGTEARILLIRNPAGSGKTFKFVRVSVILTNTTATSALIRAYLNPTITVNGTAVTPVSARAGGGAPASAILVTSAPTATAVGSRFFQQTVVSGTGSRPVAENINGEIILEPGNSILITGTPDGTNRASETIITWVEL